MRSTNEWTGKEPQNRREKEKGKEVGILGCAFLLVDFCRECRDSKERLGERGEAEEATKAGELEANAAGVG